MFTYTARSALITLVAFAMAASAAPSLSLKLSGPDTVDGVNNLKITATITNTGNETLKLLNDPRGPLDNFPTNTFVISHDETGATPVFTGVQVKYVTTSAAKYGGEDSYTVLPPSQSISVEHDLSSAYNFTTSGAGNYSFSAVNQLYYLDETNTPVEVFASHPDAHVISISGQLAVTPTTKAKRANFVGCASMEQSLTTTATKAAQSYIAAAVSYTKSQTGSTERYVAWFGTYTKPNWQTVSNILGSVNTNDFSSYTYDCSCTRTDIYAYVNSNVFGYVNLCPLFFAAPLTGSDSRGGTLVHEATHFKINGGTEDHKKGYDKALALAKKNPQQAIDNADNYEYYVENEAYFL